MLKTTDASQNTLPIEILDFKQSVKRVQSDLQQDGFKPEGQQILGEWFGNFSKIKKTVDSLLKDLSLSTEKSWAAQTNEDIELYQLLLSSIKHNDSRPLQSLFVKDFQTGLRFIESRGYYVWMRAINQGDLVIIQLLLDKAYLPEPQLIWALERAVERGDSEIIELIIKQCRENRERYIQLVFNKNKTRFKIDWCRLENIPYQYDIDIERLHELTKPSTQEEVYRVRKLPITHSGLIECGQRLGYSFSGEGICHGYTMRWIEATILGQQTRFLNRVYKIDELNRLFDLGLRLENLEQEPDWKEILWEIKAFYETLYLYQYAHTLDSVFNQSVSQYDIEMMSEIASSDEIMKLGSLKRSPILRYDEFSSRGLRATFHQLEQAIKDSYDTDPVCFLLSCDGDDRRHAITVIYDPSKEAWQWMDINLPIINSRTLAGLIRAIERTDPTDKSYLDRYDTFCISAVLPSVTVNCLAPYLTKITKFENTLSLVMSQSFLCLASWHGDFEGVTELLARIDINPNQATIDGVTPLFMAAEKGHLEVVKALLARIDINPNQAMSNGATPLFIAAQNGHLEVVKALLALDGIDPNKATIDGATTPLFIAAEKGHLEVVKALLALDSINPNQAMSDGATPLFMAAEKGHLEVVKALLARDSINPNQAMSNGATPLCVAAQKGHLEVVKALLALDGIDPNQATINGVTPLFIAAEKGHLEVVKALLARDSINPNQAMTDGETPLFIAAQNGHLEVVKALLACIDINLNLATIRGSTPLFMAAQNGHLEVVKALLARDSINPNQAMTDGGTPLFIAVQNGHLEVVKVLLASDGIDPNQATSNGATPLFIAAQEGKETIVEYLLQQGVARDIPVRASEASLTQFAMNQTTGDGDLKNRMQKIIRDYQEKNPSAEQIAITPEQIADVMGHVAVKRLFTNYCNAGVDTPVFAYGRMKS
jgi:ankyrin repeat protein